MLNTVNINMARVIGPALAGLIIASSASRRASSSNAASYVAVIVALLMMTESELRPAPPSSLGRRGSCGRASLRLVDARSCAPRCS